MSNPYVPVTITNSESTATPTNFQQMINVDMSPYSSVTKTDLSNCYWSSDTAGANVLDSWRETAASQTGTMTWWVNLGTNTVPANGTLKIYLQIPSTSQLNNTTTGEAPQLSGTYAEYDNGANVFLYYNVNPTSTTGWTIAGTAGQVSSAPSGSHYNTTNAFYANSSNGDYLYTSVSSLTSNVIISFNVYTTGLGNLFFLESSTGSGQMARLDSRGGADYSGLATTSSWTNWTAPNGIDSSPDTWYKYDISVSGTSAYAYIGSISNDIATYGTPTSSSAFTVSNNGDYMGLVGDALGSTYITYWNGLIIRTYPPNGTMPTTSAGNLVSSDIMAPYSQYVAPRRIRRTISL